MAETWFTKDMTTTRTAKATYTTRFNREFSYFIIYRNGENVACATTEREARSLIRYLREEEA